MRMKFWQTIFGSIVFCISGYAKAQVRPILPPIFGQFVQYVNIESIDSILPGRTRPLVRTKEAYCEVILKHDSVCLNIEGKEVLFRQKRYRRIPKNYTPHLRFQRRRLRAISETGNHIHTDYLKIKAITRDSLIAEYRLHEWLEPNTSRTYKGNVKIPRSEVRGVFVGPDKRMRIVQIVGAGLVTAYLIWDSNFNEK